MKYELSPDHSRFTHSRHRTFLAGHVRTGRERHLSSIGPWRSWRDSRGHADDTVRDREAPGFKFEFAVAVYPVGGTSTRGRAGESGATGSYRGSWRSGGRRVHSLPRAWQKLGTCRSPTWSESRKHEFVARGSQ